MGQRLLFSIAVVLALGACTSLRSLDGNYPNNGPLLPQGNLQLTSTISYSLEKLVVAGAGAWLLYQIYDPLAPNWQIVEAKVSENVYVFDLKMKRFHTGGSGEAMMVIKRRAEQLRRENGFASYRVVDYVEGIESSTPVAQRYAQGLVQMARSSP
ncbi:hypothetical protein [Azospira sp. I09]|jgi:hypothetical protein|uniref:hypothetical protein n=1 Tax=Azospira sp. I09 TaxID=1765049 RepID=UPI00121F1AFF|nr:hypothetical protein [Azospira sp. I09]TLN00470.1 MAG: hypothetical protein FDZ73_19360 [bacterium]BBN90386.1 hypothetical protein AZSP09_34090 [Azospira sp. I09]